MRRGRRAYNRSDWLNIREISEHLDVHPNTIRNWIRRDGLRAYKFGKTGEVRVHISDLRSFLRRFYWDLRI